MQWRPATGKPRYGQIEAAPEEMHRAGLAKKAAAESLQYALGLKQDLPAAPRGVRSVRCVLAIFSERNRRLHLDRRGPKRNLDSERAQYSHILCEEVRHRARDESKPARRAVAGSHPERVVDKIEVHRERLLAVTRGGSPLTPNVARTILELVRSTPHGPAPHAALSEREQEVLRDLARGLVCKQIAADRGISLHTVRTYVRRIYEKLQVATIAQAVATAIRSGLV